jgi:hypothetical protein
MVKGFILLLCFLFYLDLIQFSFFLLASSAHYCQHFSTVFSLKDNTQIDYIYVRKYVHSDTLYKLLFIFAIEHVFYTQFTLCIVISDFISSLLLIL